MNKFKNLKIWQRAVDLATQVYEKTNDFPDTEKYGLTSQMRRCTVSISSNIAEGAGRGTKKEFSRFLNIAYSSSYELETQLLISKNLGFIQAIHYQDLIEEIDQLQKMIYSFTKSLEKKIS